ncbi:MAG: hypothetical protein HUU46_03865 [Candidatus Hydrogenedentes bacterium]|nr:hypothetical protein [Candidatus Hydrogenedentota bacterium]
MTKHGLDNDLSSASPPPEAEEGLDNVVTQVRAWSNEDVSAPRLDAPFLRSVASSQPSSKRRERFSSTAERIGWLCVAASLLLLSLSVAGVRLEWGDASIEFGSTGGELSPRELSAKIAEIEGHFILEQSAKSREIGQLADTVSALETELRETALNLVQSQQAESATRYHDIVSLIHLTSSR